MTIPGSRRFERIASETDAVIPSGGGVIVGILFLAYELHQNNKLLTSQANLELSENRADANELMATDEGIARLLTEFDPSKLTDIDRFQRERYYVSIFTKWEWEFRQYQEGLIEDRYLPVSDWRSRLGNHRLLLAGAV